MATQNKSLATPSNGSFVGDWDVPVNANWNSIDSALGGTSVINAVAASGTVVLTSAQYTPPAIVISGALTANVIYQFPAGVGWFGAVFNATSGAFTITVASGGAGTSVSVVQGSSLVLACDGTNVRQASANSIPGGANTQIQYNNSGVFAGSTNLTWNNSTSVATVNGVITVGTTGINIGPGVSTGFIGDGTNLAIRFPTGGTFSVQSQAGASNYLAISSSSAAFSIPVSSSLFTGNLNGNATTSTSSTTSGTASAGANGFEIGGLTAARVAQGTTTFSGYINWGTGIPGGLDVGEIYFLVASA
jgi:hypothetical protein